MLIVGVLIAVCALAFGIIVVADNWGGATSDVTALGSSIGDLTLAGIFIAGVVLTLIFCLGLWLAGFTTRAHRRNALRRRAELRETRAERDQLATDLQRERDGRSEGVGVYPAEPRSDVTRVERPVEAERPVETEYPRP